MKNKKIKEFLKDNLLILLNNNKQLFENIINNDNKLELIYLKDVFINNNIILNSTNIDKFMDLFYKIEDSVSERAYFHIIYNSYRNNIANDENINDKLVNFLIKISLLVKNKSSVKYLIKITDSIGSFYQLKSLIGILTENPLFVDRDYAIIYENMFINITSAEWLDELLFHLDFVWEDILNILQPVLYELIPDSRYEKLDLIFTNSVESDIVLPLKSVIINGFTVVEYIKDTRDVEMLKVFNKYTHKLTEKAKYIAKTLSDYIYEVDVNIDIDNFVSSDKNKMVMMNNITI